MTTLVTNYVRQYEIQKDALEDEDYELAQICENYMDDYADRMTDEEKKQLQQELDRLDNKQ